MGKQGSAVRSLLTSIVGLLVGCFSRHLVLPSVGLPAACLTAVLLLPASVHAGCDYPTHIERTELDSDAITGKTISRSNADRHVPAKPCSCTGPTCSRQPLAPPAPNSVVSVRISEWGRLVPLLVLTAPQADTCIVDEPLSHPSRLPSVIFHPPRLPF